MPWRGAAEPALQINSNAEHQPRYRDKVGGVVREREKNNRFFFVEISLTQMHISHRGYLEINLMFLTKL